MPQPFDLARVKALLDNVFDMEALCLLCYDQPAFSAVYAAIEPAATKVQILTQLVAYAADRQQVETLLQLAQARDAVAYQMYQPYEGTASSPADAPLNEVASPDPQPAAPLVSPMPDDALRVFLCHASEDKPAVRVLYDRLRADGLNPWLDAVSLLPGQQWQREIPRAVRASDAILVCVSRHVLNNSGYIRDEIAYALDVAEEQPADTIFIIPVRLEDCEVPTRLARWQWVNLFEPEGYERLRQALQLRSSSVKQAERLPRRLIAALRDPIWQMIGVVVAVVALGWSVYGLYAGARTTATPTVTPTIPVTLSATAIVSATKTLSATEALPALGDEGQIAFTSDRDGFGRQIYVMNSDGTNPTRLTNLRDGPYGPAWSPDGASIVFSLDNSIYVMRADGTELTQLTKKEQDVSVDRPDWSPDGSRLVFDSYRGGIVQIYAMNSDGTEPIRLTQGEADNWAPAWSPDGAHIAFACEQDGNNEICIMKADGTELTRLTNNPANDGFPSWSPDGQYLAFHSNPGGNWGIYVMRIDGAAESRLTADGFNASNPSWSPDGSRIVFEARPDTSLGEIYVMNADGTGQIRLTNDQNDDLEPVWSP